jgi:L-threonate 2-dehydrogenase
LQIEDIMAPVVTVIAAGAMGAAVGQRLTDHGVTVLTSLAGRSEATAARAAAAGMSAANDAEIAAADFVLSILPPGDALALALHFVPALSASNVKPIYVECNAVNPATVERIASTIAPTGCAFVDAGIVGGPPKPSQPGQGRHAGPRFYASGEAAPRFAALRQYGLDVRVLDGPPGAASALKMSYAGITKGTQALGAAMLLAAARAGSAAALHEELQFSQPEMLAWLEHFLPAMPAKAYRWIAEMQEIAGFVGDDPAAGELFAGAAHFYQRIAEDFAADGKTMEALLTLVRGDSTRR